MNKILEILNEIRPDLDFDSEKQLVAQGLLDSFDLVSIISELNDVFEINIRVNDLQPENFNSVEAMMALVERKMNGA
jgi:D-alanine--poly(phosphoribitol) ligase subunit 2